MSGPLPAPFEGPGRRTLAALLLNGAAQAVCVVAGAAMVHQVFRQLEAGEAVGAAALAGLLVSGLALAGLRLAEQVQAERLGQGYAARLRLCLFEALSRQPSARAAKSSRGATLMRFVGDAAALRRWLALGLPRLAVGLASGLLALAALVVTQPALGAAAALAYAASAIAVVALGRQVDGPVRIARRRRAALAAELADRLAAMAVVRLFGQVEREARRLDRRQRALVNASVAQRRATAGLAAVAQAGAASATAAVLGTGVWLQSKGRVSLAELAGAMTLVGLVAPSFAGLGRVMAHWRAAGVSRRRLAELLARPELATPNPQTRDTHAHADAPERQVPLPGGAVRVDLHEATLDGVLHAFSATAHAGQRVAIVGPNGAGKSSLLALVARLVDADRGEVRLDGQRVQDIPLDRLQRLLAGASPDLPLLRGTVGRNLGYRQPGAGAGSRRRVARLCGVDALLRQLPDGEATRLSDGGGNLSWGQRQRVAWARALLGGPGLLLLDEPDAHLDPVSARHLDDVLARFPGTVLIVTHRLDRVRQADQVWHLDEGRLVEHGEPGRLLAQPSRTRELFARELRRVA